MHDELIFNTVKEYDDMIKICIYREPMLISHNHTTRSKKTHSKALSRRSLARSRTMLQDLCLSNEFELFCTFTFDPKRYNSKILNFCKMYMNTWIRNAKARHSKHLEYIIVPELHKSGAIHFHALFKNYEGQLRPSGVFQNGREVFNIPHWHFGFSTCCKIDNQEAVANYICKYITKDMITFGGNKRYYCSQGLSRPVHKHNVNLSFLSKLPPLFRRSLVNSDNFRADSDVEYITLSKSLYRSLIGKKPIDD